MTRDGGINLEVAQGVKVSDSMPVTLYFPGQTKDNTVYYVPVTRLIQRQENGAVAAMKELIKGPQHGSELVSALAESTRVNSVKLKGDTAIADFGKELLQYSDERKLPRCSPCHRSVSDRKHRGQKVKITVEGNPMWEARVANCLTNRSFAPNG